MTRENLCVLNRLERAQEHERFARLRLGEIKPDAVSIPQRKFLLNCVRNTVQLSLAMSIVTLNTGFRGAVGRIP